MLQFSSQASARDTSVTSERSVGLVKTGHFLQSELLWACSRTAWAPYRRRKKPILDGWEQSACRVAIVRTSRTSLRPLDDSRRWGGYHRYPSSAP